MPYSPLLVRPMREELTSAGVRELLTTSDVEEFLGRTSGTSLLVFNSVCGCAAGMARPGVRLALGHDKKPDAVASVFAGQDLDATAAARAFIPEIPPSSPSLALFKDGELAWFLPRHRIEGRTAEAVADDLTQAFDQLCG